MIIVTSNNINIYSMYIINDDDIASYILLGLVVLVLVVLLVVVVVVSSFCFDDVIAINTSSINLLIPSNTNLTAGIYRHLINDNDDNDDDDDDNDDDDL